MGINKYKSIYSIKRDVVRLVESGDLDRALRLIYDYVELVVTEPLCTAQFLGTRELDAQCQAIGKASLQLVTSPRPELSAPGLGKNVYVYIVTRLQNSGGHSKVIADLIKCRPNEPHVILATELIGKSDAEGFLCNSLSGVDVSFERAPKGGYLEKLMWLQSRLLEINPCHSYLFNHHQDSVAVAALQPDMLLRGSFYHHGDHHLCLGVYLEHLVHIDPHPMGYYNCREVHGLSNTYLPLVVDDQGGRPTDFSFLEAGELTTCTAARSNKIEIPYFVSYLDVVPELLRATGGRHIHIGKLTPWALFKIRLGLARYGIAFDRFVYVPWVQSVWQALHQYRVDLYIASFPYGGGLTLIEAMGAGVPVALHKHMHSRVLGGIDLAYPGAFSWRYPDELLDYCSSLTTRSLEESGKLSRKQYETFHTREVMQSGLDIDSGSILQPPSMRNDFFVDSDEWMFWVAGQVSLKRVVLGAGYRWVRRARAWLNSV